VTIDQFIDLIYGGVYWLIIATLILLVLYILHTSTEKS